ncbi:hypothetical protein SAMN04487995_1638 [Dyadobacter koreensis]|uniref:Outer membrane protein beta-barrel domain-containing protein n=1 Tax=Dyadobacter koreensis TaxID=408657 RepID=A0A1H6SAB4_9BACT|nr:hypothetical protein [Dyadobacter koreensis]SEI60950.1 hypothetical protein SAMN04487995_1638 [Dyadobacter koreensis]
MKNKLLLSILFFASLFNTALAQDSFDTTSTAKKYKSGMAIYAEVGLLGNNSFKGIRNEMRALGIKPFENIMASIVLAKRMETEKFFMESRLILMNSTKHSRDENVSKGIFRGIGIGVDGSPKFVNSKHWNLLIPIGWDLMLYQVKVKNDRTASFSQVVQNPNAYNTAKLHNGSFNLHAGIGADYKMNLFPKVYDQIYISGKVTYHLPIARMGRWRGDDVKITDLPSFKPNQLYAQLGLVFFPKKSHRMWGRMH